MHLPGVASVMVNDIQMGDSFPKVGLDRVHSSQKELLDQTRIPSGSFGVGEVYNRHSGLPFIPEISRLLVVTRVIDSPLPDAPIGSLDKVPILHTFLEDLRPLSNVRVDPSANFNIILVFDIFEILLWIRERLGVPGERTPVVPLHPATSQPTK